MLKYQAKESDEENSVVLSEIKEDDEEEYDSES